MQAINLNKYEYYGPEHRTRKAYRKLIDLRNRFYFNLIKPVEFIEGVEIIIYNDVPSKDLKYFGARPYYEILLLLAKSSYDDDATYRLKTDLLTVY